MNINTKTGLLSEATFHPSPHCNDRPVPERISLLVIHNISLPAGQFGNDYVRQLFMNEIDCDAHPDFDELRGKELSAHLFINRQGELHQFVPFHLRAYHAGRSSFGDELECNDYSIGIELEGTDHLPFTDNQYQSLAKVTQAIMAAYPHITRDRITGHEHIAPGRKTDPGPAFDWERYFALF